MRRRIPRDVEERYLRVVRLRMPMPSDDASHGRLERMGGPAAGTGAVVRLAGRVGRRKMVLTDRDEAYLRELRDLTSSPDVIDLVGRGGSRCTCGRRQVVRLSGRRVTCPCVWEWLTLGSACCPSHFESGQATHGSTPARRVVSAGQSTNGARRAYRAAGLSVPNRGLCRLLRPRVAVVGTVGRVCGGPRGPSTSTRGP